ncbi:MAG TPA: DNA glycosylase, partial [Chthoniobacteraceae bacterium]
MTSALSPGAAMVGRRGSKPALEVLAAPDFDLEQTLCCGQVFHWVRDGAGWVGAIGDHAAYVEQRGAELLVPTRFGKTVARYFALDHPLGEITASFPNDPAMEQAAQFCRGLRIIRQPHWECLATFITSSMKQVAHIAQISHTLRERFGQRMEWNGRVIYGYPSAEKLAALDEKVLRDCSLGYRAKNLLGTARLVASGSFDLREIERLDDAGAREALCRLPGVGVKVANCVLLFAYERIRAFPIDVWIE